MSPSAPNRTAGVDSLQLPLLAFPPRFLRASLYSHPPAVCNCCMCGNRYFPTTRILNMYRFGESGNVGGGRPER